MFPLMALGAGLGQGVEAIQQQQQRVLQQQMWQLQMQNYARQQQEQQRQTAAQAGLAALARSGGLDQFRGLSPMPTAGVGGSPGGGMQAGGALTGGGADPRGLTPFIQETAARYNIDPSVALAVFRSEGLGNPVGDRGTSFGASQLHVGGGLGDVFQRETGLDPRNWQQNERQMIDWSLKRVASNPSEGWTPYHGAARVGIGPRQGIGVAPRGSADLAAGTGDFAIPSYGEAPAATPDSVVAPQRQGPSVIPASAGRTLTQKQQYDADTSAGQRPAFPPGQKFNSRGEAISPDMTATLPGQQAGAAGQAQNLGPTPGGGASVQQQADPMAAVQQQVQQGIQKTAQTIPPPLFGRVGLQALMKQIDQANPGADEATKFMMLEGAQALLAPDAKMQWEMWKQQNDQTLKKEMTLFEHNLRLAEQGPKDAALLQRQKDLYKYEHDLRMDEPTTAPEVFVGPGGEQKWIRPGEPIPPDYHKWSATSGRGGTAKNIQVKDAEGNVTFHGLANQTGPGQWVDASGEPVDTQGRTVTPLSTTTGVQAAGMNQRIIYGANETQRALDNLTKMPMGSTLGWFGGAQAQTAKELKEGLSKGLANALTPTNAQMMVAMARGVDRGLSMLASAGAAQGLVGLSEQMKGELPQVNDDGFTILTKFANMRQIVEAANETLQASDLVGDKQKALMSKVTERVIESVPWTVADVIEINSNPDDATVRDFAKKLHVGEPGKRGQKGGAGGGDGASSADEIPLPAEFANDPDNTGYKRGNEVWVKRGNKLVKTPGGEVTPPSGGPAFSAPIPPAQ